MNSKFLSPTLRIRFLMTLAGTLRVLMGSQELSQEGVVGKTKNIALVVQVICLMTIGEYGSC